MIPVFILTNLQQDHSVFCQKNVIHSMHSDLFFLFFWYLLKKFFSSQANLTLWKIDCLPFNIYCLGFCFVLFFPSGAFNLKLVFYFNQFHRHYVEMFFSFFFLSYLKILLLLLYTKCTKNIPANIQ